LQQKYKTRNSAVADSDKPRDAFEQMQWRGWPKPPEKIDSSHPAFQGQSTSLGPTRIDSPSMISY